MKISNKIKNLSKQIELLQLDNDLICVLLYGTFLKAPSIAKDMDIIVVVRSVHHKLMNLFNLLYEHHLTIDFNVYSLMEIENNLSYLSREYKLEYLAKGHCIYGDNIFISKFLNVSKLDYKKSILIRSIEHIQIARQRYFSSNFNEKDKIYILKKYFLRVSRNILLFNDFGDHGTIYLMQEKTVLEKLFQINLIAYIPNLNNINIDRLFDCFDLLSNALLICKASLREMEV